MADRGVARIRRRRRAKSNDHKVGMAAHEPLVVVADIVPIRQERAIFERHLSIFQQIVEQRQHIALGLFDAVEDEQVAPNRSEERLRGLEDNIPAYDFPSLL